MSTSAKHPHGVSSTAALEDLEAESGGYEAPRITWREPYQPLVFGISCAKVQGNPSCIAPVSS